MSGNPGVLGALSAVTEIKQHVGRSLDSDGPMVNRRRIQNYLASASPEVIEGSDPVEEPKPAKINPFVVISWIYRVCWCPPMTLIQWMPLALSLVQLSSSDDPQVPDWVKGMIEPNLFLVLYSLIHMLVSVYIVNPALVVESIKHLVMQHQAPRDGCSKTVVQVKLGIILLLAAFATVIGGFAFYPVIGAPPNLHNESYAFWVNLIEEMSSMTALWQIMWWSTNLWTYSLSGINFATKTVDLIVNYFRAPYIREADRILKKLKNIGFDQDVMHGYVEMVRQGYLQYLSTLEEGSRNRDTLDEYLKTIRPNTYDLLTTVIHKKLRESVSITNYIAKIAVLLFIIGVAAGVYSFWVVAFLSLPVALCLVEIAVSTGMIHWLATSTVDFLRRLPALGQKIFSWYLTPFHMLIHAAWLLYTSIGSIGEIFLEANPQFIPFQIVSNSLMIFLFNIPAVFFLFLLIEKGFLCCSSSTESKEKLRWMKFTEECHKQLLFALNNEFIAGYLTEAFREEGELQQLVFLYGWGGLPMGAGSSRPRKRRLTVGNTIRYILGQYGYDSAELNFEGSSEEGNHLGGLSNLQESSRLWRIISDVCRWGMLLAVFIYSMLQYDPDSENPMQRLLDWGDGLIPQILIPMLLLAISAFLPGVIGAIRYCLGQGFRYRDINAVACGKRRHLAVEYGYSAENRLLRGIIQLLPWLILAVPVLYVLYYTLSQLLELTVVGEIANFSADDQRAVQGFVQAAMYLLFSIVSAAIGFALGQIPTHRGQLRLIKGGSVFRMRENARGNSSARAVTIARLNADEETDEEADEDIDEGIDDADTEQIAVV